MQRRQGPTVRPMPQPEPAVIPRREFCFFRSMMKGEGDRAIRSGKPNGRMMGKGSAVVRRGVRQLRACHSAGSDQSGRRGNGRCRVGCLPCAGYRGRLEHDGDTLERDPPGLMNEPANSPRPGPFDRMRRIANRSDTPALARRSPQCIWSADAENAGRDGGRRDPLSVPGGRSASCARVRRWWDTG